jgi:AcrR family transcriptional regulator
VAVKEGHRQRQAQATREQVAAAARRLFADRGYVATTIAAIAEAADIPAPTIYSAFGSKKKILDEVMELWIRGSGVRQEHEEALLHPDPEQRLRMLAGWNARQFEQGLDVIETYDLAARSDPDMMRSWRRVLAARERVTREFLASIEPRLAPGLDGAVDLFIALTQPGIYRTLVVERGWSTERFAAWLGDLFVAQLLRPSG